MSARKLQLNGRRELASGANVSRKNENRKKTRQLELLLGHTFDKFQDEPNAALRARSRTEFVFHMMDWNADLETLAEIYQNPSKLDRKESRRLIFAFLAHVPQHLNAAARLLLHELPDPVSQPVPERIS